MQTLPAATATGMGTAAMDERVALHAAARRYCYEGLGWSDIDEQLYREVGGAEERSLDSESDAGMRARWGVLSAILLRIEQTVPESFATTEELRAHLLEIVQSASEEDEYEELSEGDDEDEWLGIEEGSEGDLEEEDAEDDEEDWDDPIFGDDDEEDGDPEETERAIAQERARFSAYLVGLTSEELKSVQPLFYRRVLTKEETERLWRDLELRWGVGSDHDWWPIAGGPPANALAFNDWDFAEHISVDVLRATLAEHGVRRVYTLAERGIRSYEMDLEVYTPLLRRPDETFSTSASNDWLIYVSHEESVTVGGRLLIDLVQRELPQWEDQLRSRHVGPFVPGLRGKTWYRTRVRIRGRPRRRFAAAVPALLEELEKQPNLRNPRGWWDSNSNQIVLEVEHWGENAEKASESLEDAVMASVESSVVRWNVYEPWVEEVEEIE